MASDGVSAPRFANHPTPPHVSASRHDSVEKSFRTTHRVTTDDKSRSSKHPAKRYTQPLRSMSSTASTQERSAQRSNRRLDKERIIIDIDIVDGSRPRGRSEVRQSTSLSYEGQPAEHKRSQNHHGGTVARVLSPL
ncbi:hypothetical protein E4U32_004845 [Claviceps aff. humidiphila group G2b]|nr:hypothetical protein E4U32_004845 [Claviceps aff. humidiphila group G2b]